MNLPAPVAAEMDGNSLPVRLRLSDKALKVAAIEDTWRIDEEWWRETPVSRVYYKVTLADGRILTIFRDMGTGRFFRQ